MGNCSFLFFVLSVMVLFFFLSLLDFLSTIKPTKIDRLF